MFRLIAIDFSQKSPHVSLLSPTSPCELSEREVTSPSNLKVVGALDNYSLVFVIFINFFGQLKVLFSSPDPKGQVSLTQRVRWAIVTTERPSSVVRPLTFHILINSSEATGPIWTKLWWNGSWMAPFQNCVRWSRLPTKLAAKLKIEKRGDEILIVHCCFSISQNELKFNCSYMARSSLTYIPGFSVKFFFQPIYTDYAN
jgi:hypothetical protein